MKLLERVLLPLLITLPVIFAGLVTLAPQPVELMNAWDKVQLYETNDQGQKAVPYLHIILEYQPWRNDLWERIGEHEFSSGNYDKAIEAYTSVDLSGEISVQGLYNLGNAYFQIGDSKSASAIWLRLIEYKDVKAEMLAAVTNQLRSSGDLDGALEAAKRWSKEDPLSTEAAWISGLLLSVHAPQDAVPKLIAASQGEGEEAAQAKEYLEVVNQAVDEPNRAYQLVLIGQRLASLHQWDVAEAALQEAVQLDPEYAEAWALLGEVEQNLGKDGWNSLIRAKTLNNESDLVISALVLYWKRQEKYEMALAYLQKLAARYPQEGNWYLEIGNTLAQSGDMLSAMNAYQRAAEIEPDDPQIWQTLAVFSATYGFDADAFSIPAISRALELAPKDPTVLDDAGWVYLTLGEMEKAEQFLQLALEEDGDFVEAKLHLAQVYIATNRLAQALPLLEEAVDQTDDRTTAMMAQRLLDKYFPGQ